MPVGKKLTPTLRRTTRLDSKRAVLSVLLGWHRFCITLVRGQESRTELEGANMIDGEARNEGRITVFQLKDDLSADRVKSFVKRIYSLLDEGRYHLVIDLSQVYEISLIGMVGLSSIFNRCRQNGGALKVSGLTPAVRKAFRGTNLINTIEVYEETMDAVKSFRSQNLLRTKHYSGSFFLKEKNAFVGWERLPMSGHVH